ncbi:NAD-dependent epimerase/dehydratase [Nocardia terpenica]|uniref:NAD-dependent epimerase/dehydratase family protein n=1 Tax=Nocardia terpenica TaxID=455432 RepID=UPI001894DA20|nr:NAD-dependent epimerase/dehydratase [Nocardia terpenica]MBF6063293.1 NAD-dependent epimerase/dehydratase [Nocardia terpenica]MBF6105849.1 NAD-dependent epimerase/dehydratase [Nocardia terpenica]MBF6113567.1 NAD-dependent epimerase/dehydratase [Nocardia terpenica]MBF6119590.1 NAD-dependent epimerase/dehydratase [Nocardia terpenica]MBF6152001.1 NAD-dependent epimerase/dehydratase [Nocardia terpenica]
MTTRESDAPARWTTVLGASGFIGSALVDALSSRPIRLRAVARRPVHGAPKTKAHIDIRTADLTSTPNLHEVLADSDAVVHLVKDTAGWRDAAAAAASERVNVGVLSEVLDYFRAHPGSGPPPTVVFAGSSSQVGVPPRLPVDGTESDCPRTPYDRQKQAAELLLKAATDEGVVRGITLRLATVYGQESTSGPADHGVLTAMVRRAVVGEALTLWHDGAIERDFVHVRDVADAFVAALDHATALAGSHWLVGSGTGTRIDHAFAQIAELVSAHTGRSRVPVRSVPAPDGVAPTDLHSMVVDPSAFGSVTGWHNRIALRDGLKRTIAALAGAAAPSARE